MTGAPPHKPIALSGPKTSRDLRAPARRAAAHSWSRPYRRVNLKFYALRAAGALSQSVGLCRPRRGNNRAIRISFLASSWEFYHRFWSSRAEL